MTSQPTQRLSLFALTAMVVGSMVGSGIFSLPRTFGIATGPFGAIFAWCIAAGGMYTLARVFQALAERKPDLDAGVYAYAKAGFGDYPGFLSALGYWIGSCIGNVSYWVLIKSTLGAFFPVFGDGNTVVAIVGFHAWFPETMSKDIKTIITGRETPPLVEETFRWGFRARGWTFRRCRRRMRRSLNVRAKDSSSL